MLDMTSRHVQPGGRSRSRPGTRWLGWEGIPTHEVEELVRDRQVLDADVHGWVGGNLEATFEMLLSVFLC